eukprot:scaffold222129_cov57-Attheya_sp.AAC.3
MVLSAQAQRNWKLAAIVCSAATGAQAILFTNYNEPDDDTDIRRDMSEPHVFTGIQTSMQEFVDSWTLASSSPRVEERQDSQPPPPKITK